MTPTTTDRSAGTNPISKRQRDNALTKFLKGREWLAKPRWPREEKAMRRQLFSMMRAIMTLVNKHHDDYLLEQVQSVCGKNNKKAAIDWLLRDTFAKPLAIIGETLPNLMLLARDPAWTSTRYANEIDRPRRRRRMAPGATPLAPPKKPTTLGATRDVRRRAGKASVRLTDSNTRDGA